MQPKSTERFLFVIAPFILAFPLLGRSYWFPAIRQQFDTRHDGLSIAMRRQVNTGFRECGRVRIGESRIAADACSISALRARIPFIVRYDYKGEDSAISNGLVGDSGGRLHMFWYDGDPMGGGAHYSASRERIKHALCFFPTVEEVSGHPRLECSYSVTL